jgi:hypothetical protein
MSLHPFQTKSKFDMLTVNNACTVLFLEESSDTPEILDAMTMRNSPPLPQKVTPA